MPFNLGLESVERVSGDIEPECLLFLSQLLGLVPFLYFCDAKPVPFPGPFPDQLENMLN